MHRMNDYALYEQKAKKNKFTVVKILVVILFYGQRLLYVEEMSTLQEQNELSTFDF